MRTRLSVMLTTWALCIALTLTSCDMKEPSDVPVAEVVINNNLFRYGMYCGPGPDDTLWATTEPVDSVDQICQNHDKAYRTCLEGLSEDAGIRHRLNHPCLPEPLPTKLSLNPNDYFSEGFKMPKILHQIMPIRGYMPDIVTRKIFTMAPKYMSCMHYADKNMVSEFDDHVEKELLPRWWSNPEEAPVGAQGIAGN